MIADRYTAFRGFRRFERDSSIEYDNYLLLLLLYIILYLILSWRAYGVSYVSLLSVGKLMLDKSVN